MTSVQPGILASVPRLARYLTFRIAEASEATAAHVRRTAQESFDPAAFVLRRSMPWADGPRAGLA